MKFFRVIPSLAVAGLVAGLLSALPASAQQTRADAEKDPVLKAMLTEMDRSMNQLQLKDFAKPFFIQYRIEDVDDFQTRAEFGATEGVQHAHQRIARITVRVGDFKTDSSGGRGDGALQLAALDNDPIALRTALWAATDQAYKAALSAYAQKQAALKQVQTQPEADDFSREKPVVSLSETATLNIDENAWVDRVARASGLYKDDAQAKAGEGAAQYSNAQFQARVANTWLVSSEGSIVRKSAQQYMVVYAVGTQAPDGMRLDRSYASTGTSLKDLDTPEVFNRHALDVIASLAELRKAPLVEEEYHGPVLLSADAGADTLRGLLAGGVAATRPRLGTEARTNGPFASSFHAAILPEFMDAVDDPTMKSFDGKGLVGAYDVDDEGVPAQAVKVVNAGRLENYLLSRTPVRDFPVSNGHGRAGITGPAQPSISVFKISSSSGVSDEDLNKKLLALAKDRGLSHAYYIQTLGGPGVPRLLYRIAADGKREMVRGASLEDVDQRALRSSIAAAGKDLYTGNYFGDVPQTVLAPALLFEDATIRRANEKNGKLPFYPPPE
jgi:Predicted Zn-dependent proteases and their inactivated homologs